MKKILALIAILVWSPVAYAGTVSLNTISADSTASTFNSNFTTLANLVNGTIEGSTDSGSTIANIKADSVFEINMADDANPRLRDSELFNITYDTSSGGNLIQGGVVESGCVPADDTDLTSDISACVAYVNGYRISKAATAQTYTASRDNYLDLSQTGVYTNTAVTNGATAPAVAANSVRLAKVVTDGTEITSVTSLYTTRVPGLIIPANYRDGLIISRDSTTTVTVGPGSAEVNNAMVAKTTLSTLTISTAGDWAGGSSLRAADTFGFVGMDSSGNLKLHTTAPTHDNYAVSTTAGKKRYATWSSTVYRILGWFYMDGNGSGNVEVASNIKEHGLPNSIQSADLTVVAFSATTFTDVQRTRFYSSGGPILLTSIISSDAVAGSVPLPQMMFQRGSTNLTDSTIGGSSASAAAYMVNIDNDFLDTTAPQGGLTYDGQIKIDVNSMNMRGRKFIVREE